MPTSLAIFASLILTNYILLYSMQNHRSRE
nr:MAG TPA: hypothetical protein [Caudoviricetes sp.]DAX15819.1 MAG TPA: hypothetical protein [Caudoviricetes sp.]